VLDVGAGIGRVTRHVLLPLFDDVVLLEPVTNFIDEACRAARAGEWRDLPVIPASAAGGVEDEEGKASRKEQERREKEAKKGQGKRVWMVQGGLQGFDPAYPVRREAAVSRGVFGRNNGEKDRFGEEEQEVVYDV
jgi:protein N-terminal methyltransferase